MNRGRSCSTRARRAARGHPLPGRLRPGEAARARRDQQHEQRLQQPGGGRRGLLLHRQDLLLQESAPGQAPRRPASEWSGRRALLLFFLRPGVAGPQLHVSLRGCLPGRSRRPKSGFCLFSVPGTCLEPLPVGVGCPGLGKQEEGRGGEGPDPAFRARWPLRPRLGAAGCGGAVLRTWRLPQVPAGSAIGSPSRPSLLVRPVARGPGVARGSV